MPEAYNLIFFGTPEFALPALEALHNSRHRISLVVTQPDRPKGRGRKKTSPPVKIAAEEMGYPILQPDTIKTDDFLDKIQSTAPDFLIVVAFGQLLAKKLLRIPRIDTLNIHPSLLPAYRGPAPIQWAIINGETETGVTIMSLDTGMDTGDILVAEKAPIKSDDTAATLHDRLAQAGAVLLRNALEKFSDNTIRRIPQDHARASSAPLLTKNDGRIDWQQTTAQIDARIRGVTPWPGAFTLFQGSRLKIFKVKPAQTQSAAIPGTVISGFSDELRVATGDGALSILEIQGASGKRMPIQDFLRGARISPGAAFE